MALNKLQPRRGRSPANLMSLCEFVLRHVFEPIQNFSLFNAPFGNEHVTVLAPLNGESQRLHRGPELQVVHPLKPVSNVILVFEFPHEIRISNLPVPAQIWAGLRRRHHE